MTCIVGYLELGRMWMGGDSAGVAGDSITIRKDAKVFRREEFLYGFTSSFRMGQLLRFKFQAPKHNNGTPVFEYMVVQFIEALRKTMQDGGYSKKSDNVEHGGHFLVGYRQHLFCVESDFQVGEAAFPYDAVGCGAELAKGALHALHKQNGLSVRKKIRAALSASAQFNSGVAPPFRILSLATKESK